MGKKDRSLRIDEGRDRNNISTENHMEIFWRLARVVNMHGTPGERKKKQH